MLRNKTLIIRWIKIFIISIFYGYSLYPYLPFWIHLMGASLFLGFTTYLGVSLVIDALQNRRIVRLIKAALSGHLGRDGKSRAVLGKIYPVDVPISAPFSRKGCSILSYDIYQQYWTKRGVKNGTSVVEPIIYSGYHQAPSEIRTGYEQVKILGFPELSDVPEVETTQYGRIDSFIEQTSFTQPKGVFIKGVNDLSKAIHVGENGAASKDFQFRQPVPGHGLKSREQAIEKGSDVCLIGIFDAARGGIVPADRPFGWTMKVIPGTGNQVLSKLTKDSGTIIAFGFVVAAFCISVGLLPYAPDSLLKRMPAGDKLAQYREETLARNAVFTRQKEISEKTNQKIPVSKAVVRAKLQPISELAFFIQNGDLERLREKLRNGMDPDTHIPIGNGYSLPLIEAINFNQLDIARLFLESGADINALNSHMVSGLDAAVSSRNTEAVRLLLGSGAEICLGDAQRLSPINRAILNQDAETLTLLLEAGADPSPPGCEMVLAALPANSREADRIREILDNAQEKPR